MAETERNYRLLIVDDDETDRRFYHRLLSGPSCGVSEIFQAADGAAGLAALRTQSPDCVLLDFSLPDMTGLEFLNDAAAVDGTLPCAVVLVSGAGSESVAVAAMKQGAQDYLVKDQVNVRDLWRTITGAVAQTELRRRLDGSLRELTTANMALLHEAAIRQAAEVELRRAKDAAEQGDLAKTRFVAMVTHELRTPLNGILGYAELLRIEGELSARQEARVAAMLQAGRHLREMIEAVLDFAGTESGEIVLHPAPVAIRDLSESCIGCIGPMATAHGLGLRLVTAHDTPRQIIADPARLPQVLLNLLGNAVKYTEAGGVELRVLAGAVPGGLRVEVADTGRGIDEADRDRLFRDFERLDATASTEGAGLGLAIAARTVERMGGTIGHAANPGGGSVFWLELPAGEMASAEVPEAAQSARGMPIARPASGRHVLLVDDIEMNHEVIGAFLSAAGHTVVSAHGGRDAVRLAREQAFHLILMDLRMPDIDGLEATRRIRALPTPHGQVPILALTAVTMRDQIAQCRQAGMDGHLAKPIDYATLTEAIAGALRASAPRATAEHAVAAAVEIADAGLIGTGSIGMEPAAEAADDDGAEEPTEPRFDRATLDRTLAVLSPVGAVIQLQSLHERHAEMLLLLDQPAVPAALMDTAHSLASVSGMFGFAALSAVARRFADALSRGGSAVDRLAPQMRTEIGLAQVALDELLLECHALTVRAQTAGDQTAGDQTAGDQTAGDRTAGDQAAQEQTSQARAA
jgi:signal transduction histidine kinase/HPt (histidine-containing phosphotransfer) domain-containing protein